MLSNFKALLRPGRLILRIEHPDLRMGRLRRKSGQNLVFMISSSLSIDPARYGQMLTNDEGQSLKAF